MNNIAKYIYAGYVILSTICWFIAMYYDEHSKNKKQDTLSIVLKVPMMLQPFILILCL